jgi:hypothetical protein
MYTPLITQSHTDVHLSVFTEQWFFAFQLLFGLNVSALCLNNVCTEKDFFSTLILQVPAEGLFYPSLLAPEEYSALMRPWYHVDHEDVADDSLQEANKRNEAMEPGFVNGNLNGAYVSAGNAEGFPANSEDNMRDRVEELSIGLQQCIVNSILSIGPLKTCDPRIRISNQIVVYQLLHMAALLHTIRACRLRLKVGLQ